MEWVSDSLATIGVYGINTPPDWCAKNKLDDILPHTYDDDAYGIVVVL